MASVKKQNEAFDILKNYNGENPYILRLKKNIYINGNVKLMGDYQVEYILKNHQFIPKEINKIVKIADWYGEKKREDWGINFTPKVLKIITLFGETEKTFHCCVQYQKSVPPVMCFLAKNGILTNFLIEDYNQLTIDFERYNKLSNYQRTLFDHQQRAIKFLLSRKKCILADDMGLGKLEPISALIPTPNGFKRMGDLKVGDYVFSMKGKPTKITKVYPHKNKEIYKITFNDNTFMECGLEHLFLVRKNGMQKGEWKTMSLEMLLNEGLINSLNGKYKWEIPICDGVEYIEQKYDIQPYDLGLCLNNNSKLLEHDEVKNIGITRNSKYIPDNYKLGSYKQRLELFKGLLSSNGTVMIKEDKIYLRLNSEDLVNDVLELVFSLGGIAKTKICSNEYYIEIEINENLFSLKKKKEKKYKKYIVSAEYIRNEDAQCIMVDDDTHTYLTGKNYIVTHNTTSLSVSAIEGNFDSVLIICPASLKNNWKKELLFYVPEKDITVIENFNDKNKSELEEFLGYGIGKSKMTKAELLEEAKKNGQWKNNRFVIINYDIIDKFLDNKRTYTNEQFEEVLNNSPMLQYINNRKSLLIIDEAHLLSDSKSIRYKTIKGLIRKGNPEYIFLATGTPITNNPANLYCVLNLIENDITGDWKYYMKRYCDAKEFCRDKNERNKWSNIFIKKLGKHSWYDLNDDEKQALNEYLHQHCKFITIPNGDSNLDELKERISHIYLRRDKSILTLPKKTVNEIYYDLSLEQENEYNKLWEEYELEKKKEDSEKEINKDLLEGAIYRQYLSMEMVPNTIKLIEPFINKKEKVVIACCYDNELYKLQEYYGDKCVIYNGKMSLKQKDDAIEKFINNPDILVFIGNLKAAGVGITLICSHILVFNDFDYVPSWNKQMSDRIYRIGQKEHVEIYYQIFKNTQYEKMWEINERKQLITDAVIKTEEEK